MQIYQCPNCGRTYTEFENVYYCGTCNYKLQRQEDINERSEERRVGKECRL